MQLHSYHVCNGYCSILDLIQVACTYMAMLFDHNYHVLYPKLLLGKVHNMAKFHLFLKTMTLAHRTVTSDLGPLAH